MHESVNILLAIASYIFSYLIYTMYVAIAIYIAVSYTYKAIATLKTTGHYIVVAIVI